MSLDDGNSIIQLSRRPWWLWLLPILSGLGLCLWLVGAQHDAKLPVATKWGYIVWLSFATGALLWQAATMPITGYDADHLYLFGKAGTKRIALASFYKLKEDGGGYWSIHYSDEQGRKKKLTIGFLGRGDSSSIHGFIEAIWQHNPQLDVRHYWWFK